MGPRRHLADDTRPVLYSFAGPDLGDFIKGSDLAGYSVHAPRPKVRQCGGARCCAAAAYVLWLPQASASFTLPMFV